MSKVDLKGKNALVTGANGFVGRKLMETCKGTVPCPSLRDATEDQILRIVEESGADTIIHTAVISDIGACAANPDASYHANVRIPVFLAKAARGRKLICFSSDQVYSSSYGDGPYTEDMARPENTYAQHKLEMENRVLDIAPDSVMLRAEWMYDYGVERPNYFMNVFSAKSTVSFSSKNHRGVTYLKEVAESMETVIRLPGGVYNFGSETTMSMYEITVDFLRFLHKDLPVNDSAPQHNLWMNCGKARKLGIMFSTVEAGLRKCALDYHLL
jgi:dTDP-4-dehydrorhamnose reductase